MSDDLPSGRRPLPLPPAPIGTCEVTAAAVTPGIARRGFGQPLERHADALRICRIPPVGSESRAESTLCGLNPTFTR